MQNTSKPAVLIDECMWPTVRSPCVGICQCNEENVCKGCGRTRREIAEWMNMTDDEKQECKEKCKPRLARLILKGI